MQPELPEITTAWVKASMQPLYKKKIIKEQVGTRMVRKTKGLFNKTSFEAEEPVYESKEKWVPTGEYSDTEVNIEEFSSNINKMCQELAASGYKVTQFIPINSGRYKYEYKEVGSTQRILGNTEAITGGGYGYGYGYGITDGVIIVAELKV
nr:hypothetical protein [Pseudomonas sp.]